MLSTSVISMLFRRGGRVCSLTSAHFRFHTLVGPFSTKTITAKAVRCPNLAVTYMNRLWTQQGRARSD